MYLLNKILVPLLVSTVAFGQKPLDTTMIVSIGGIQQFVHVKTKDSTRPLLLFLHGGPGQNSNGVAPDLAPLHKKHVLIVYDQRGSGLSEIGDVKTYR